MPDIRSTNNVISFPTDALYEVNGEAVESEYDNDSYKPMVSVVYRPLPMEMLDHIHRVGIEEMDYLYEHSSLLSEQACVRTWTSRGNAIREFMRNVCEEFSSVIFQALIEATIERLPDLLDYPTLVYGYPFVNDEPSDDEVFFGTVGVPAEMWDNVLRREVSRLEKIEAGHFLSYFHNDLSTVVFSQV